MAPVKISLLTQNSQAPQARSKSLPINELLTVMCRGPLCTPSYPARDLATDMPDWPWSFLSISTVNP